MSQSIIKTEDYLAFIQDIKQRIQGAQIKASVTVNQALLHLYWELAERIVAKQQDAAWGDGFLLQMSRDLQAEFPAMKGFSKRNLELMRQWYRFWSASDLIAKQAATQLGQQLVAPIFQVPWWHNVVIISKIKTYMLRNIDKPIGVSEYTITQNLPEELKSSLPSIEEIEAELGGRDE
ncbi:MAG: DUF1016 N-terminal domain-containing protein [Gallionellaceae bacterium]